MRSTREDISSFGRDICARVYVCVCVCVHACVYVFVCLCLHTPCLHACIVRLFKSGSRKIDLRKVLFCKRGGSERRWFEFIRGIHTFVSVLIQKPIFTSDGRR